MPLFCTRGAASARGFGMFASLGGGYWIGLLGDGVEDDFGHSIAVDSSGNVYVCGYTQVSGTSDFQIAKYNTSGTIQWQRSLNGGSSDAGESIAVDSSGNVYVCGRSNSFDGSQDIQIAKYDTSGTIQWQRRLRSLETDFGYSVAVDSSGNVYVCGYSDISSPGASDFQIAKYDTSGTIQWQRRLGGGTSIEEGHSIAVDSSGNVYVCGYSNSTIGQYAFQIAKYDTSGTIQWQRSLGSGVSNDFGFSIAVDLSGNVYVCGRSNASGTNNFQIAKYNTSGTIQWQRSLDGGSNDAGESIAVDSSGNVYVCGRSNPSGVMKFQIAKYDTSGTIQWQRRLGGGGSDFGYSIAVDSSGNVYVCGYSNATGSNNFLFAKLPGDGSKTGTYTVGGYSFTYASSSLTDAVSTLTDAASSLTSAASSLASAASSLTSSVTTI